MASKINFDSSLLIWAKELTKDNFELQIGTNHFGHFILTYLLCDKLKESGNPRIIIVSSSFHSFSGTYDIDFDNIHFQNGGNDILQLILILKKPIFFLQSNWKEVKLERILLISLINYDMIFIEF